MRMWWLPPSVAVALIASGTVLVLGSIWLMPASLGVSTDAAPATRLFAAVVGVALGAGMIVNGIARSTRPPEGSA